MSTQQDSSSEPLSAGQGSSSEPLSPMAESHKRGIKSAAWKHYKKQKIDGSWKAICKYCDEKLGGEAMNGTSHLHDHFQSCKHRSSLGDTIVIGDDAFNHKTARKELMNMVVLHEYPISIVEQVGFRRFCNALQPLFKEVSPNTIQMDIMNLYESERKKTMKILERNQSRIAITTDMWTSKNQNKGYMAIRAYYIDDSWTLRSRLIRFVCVPIPRDAAELANALTKCMIKWNLDRKWSTLTVDNCDTSDAIVQYVSEKVPRRSFILNRSLFHMHCCAHMLNLVVNDGLKVISSSIEKIRDSIHYWTASHEREKRFEANCYQIKVPFDKKLVLDYKTKWNSTYLMLAAAISYKDVFSRLHIREPEYKSLPSEEDWEMTKEICDKLEIFHSMTKLFTGTKYPTLNICFPKLCEVRLALGKWITSSNGVIREMVESMMSKFDKYWNAVIGVMAVGTVLDPRFKMLYLSYVFEEIYGQNASDEIRKVTTIFEDLVKEYEQTNKGGDHLVESSRSVTSMTNKNSVTNQAKGWMGKFSLYIREYYANVPVKSELDIYLEEKVLPGALNDQFDILAWWKLNGLKYPTLQRIAKDFLAIPISTVASDSSFCTDSRLLSTHRSKLLPKTVEAIMCSQDWLWNEIQGDSKLDFERYTMHDDEDVDDESNGLESSSI